MRKVNKLSKEKEDMIRQFEKSCKKTFKLYNELREYFNAQGIDEGKTADNLNSMTELDLDAQGLIDSVNEDLEYMNGKD